MVAELPDGTDKVVTSTAPEPGGSLTYEVTLSAKKAGEGVVRTEIVADEVPGTTVLETPVTVTKSVKDNVKPTVTVKDGAEFTVGSDGTYSKVSYKLYDAGKVDKVVLKRRGEGPDRQRLVGPELRPSGRVRRQGGPEHPPGPRRGGQRHDRPLHADEVNP